MSVNKMIPNVVRQVSKLGVNNKRTEIFDRNTCTQFYATCFFFLKNTGLIVRTALRKFQARFLL